MQRIGLFVAALTRVCLYPTVTTKHAANLTSVGVSLENSAAINLRKGTELLTFQGTSNGISCCISELQTARQIEPFQTSRSHRLRECIFVMDSSLFVVPGDHVTSSSSLRLILEGRQ
jgi:hypothetical protein